jgi:hypothetical protein
MTRKLLLSLAGASAAICIGFSVAQAAPAGATLDSLRTLGLGQSNVEKTHWRRYRHCHRRCWRSRWGYRCRRVCHGGRRW